MNRNRTIFLGAFVLAAGILVSLVARPASAERPFNLRSMHGTYVGGMIEVRLPPSGTGPLEYCDIGGTLIFDGAGGGFSHITRRCSIEGTVTDVLSFTYAVSTDGIADLLFSSGTPGQFRLAQGGAIAFINSVGSSDATVLVQNGTFARQ